MEGLVQGDVVRLLLALGVLLGAARVFGELARRLNQPAVIGEILAGVLLGPTILGGALPQVAAFLFPSQGPVALALDALMTLAITLFLLVAGLEVNLSTLWRQGRAAIGAGLSGIIGPFTLGFAAAWYLPAMMGRGAGVDPFLFALFMATALSISALPVIAKTLIDLNLYRSDFGMVVVASAVFNDLLGWIIFAAILALLGSAPGAVPGIFWAVPLVLLFALLMLTVLRQLIHRLLPWIHAHTSWPGGILGFSLVLALFAGAFTEWLGVHAIFGSFLAGVALGDSRHLREKTRATIDQFVSHVFAPLFFAGIGLKVDFLHHFNLPLVAAVLVIAVIGKVGGCWAGGRLAGMPPREALALGFAMNARGAMEIILSLLALRYGLIGTELFVALVVMALLTSVASGPILQRLLHLRRPRPFTRFLRSRAFLPRLRGVSREEAIRELAVPLAALAGLDPGQLAGAVLDRERLMPTGIGHGIAIPHARLESISDPLVGLGISASGIDFDAPDGCPANLVFLLLTPTRNDGIQLELLADIAASLKDPEVRARALSTTSFTEFVALVRSERGG